MTPKINGQCHRNKYFISGFPNDNAFMYGTRKTFVSKIEKQ